MKETLSLVQIPIFFVILATHVLGQEPVAASTYSFVPIDSQPTASVTAREDDGYWGHWSGKGPGHWSNGGHEPWMVGEPGLWADYPGPWSTYTYWSAAPIGPTLCTTSVPATYTAGPWTTASWTDGALTSSSRQSHPSGSWSSSTTGTWSPITPTPVATTAASLSGIPATPQTYIASRSLHSSPTYSTVSSSELSISAPSSQYGTANYTKSSLSPFSSASAVPLSTRASASTPVQISSTYVASTFTTPLSSSATNQGTTSAEAAVTPAGTYTNTSRPLTQTPRTSTGAAVGTLLSIKKQDFLAAEATGQGLNSSSVVTTPTSRSHLYSSATDTDTWATAISGASCVTDSAVTVTVSRTITATTTITAPCGGFTSSGSAPVATSAAAFAGASSAASNVSSSAPGTFTLTGSGASNAESAATTTSVSKSNRYSRSVAVTSQSGAEALHGQSAAFGTVGILVTFALFLGGLIF